MTLTELSQNWTDTEEYHRHIHEMLVELVNSNPKLKEHRDYVEQNVWGFGERSFWYAWKVVLDELPDDAKLLEIGVFKGATLSVWKLLKSGAKVYGVTPMNDTGLEWNHEDGYYSGCIAKIHDDFELEQPTIIKGLSNDICTINWARDAYNVVYIDGDHSEQGALSDLENYSPMVKVGGFLVIDDCCCDMHQPWGYFQGIKPVQDAFDRWDKSGFEFVFNVKHLRIMRRVK